MTKEAGGLDLKTLLGVLAGAAVFVLAMSLRLLVGGRKSLLEQRLKKGGEERREELIAEAVWMRVRSWNPVPELVKRLLGGNERENLSARLRQAGMEPANMTPDAFMSLRVNLAALAFVGTSAGLAFLGSGTRSLVVGIGAGLLAYLLPSFWLDARIGERKDGVERGLVNFVSMLAVTCEAGLGLPEALGRVGPEFGGQIAAEVERMLAEVRMGALWPEVLKRATERYDSQDFALVLGSIATAITHGTPIAGVLRETARQLRQARRTRAQEQAQKATAKMLVPIIFFMFIPLAVVVMGPPVLNLFKSLVL